MNTPVNAIRDQFVGAWELVAQSELHADGTSVSAYGENPLGLLMYQPNGWMSVQILRRERRSGMSLNSIHTARTEFLGYYGTYVINADAGIVTHYVIGSSYPAYISSQQRRQFAFEDDGATLVLQADGGSEGHISRTLVWRRS